VRDGRPRDRPDGRRRVGVEAHDSGSYE
jgi:hypothetical protein